MCYSSCLKQKPQNVPLNNTHLKNYNILFKTHLKNKTNSVKNFNYSTLIACFVKLKENSYTQRKTRWKSVLMFWIILRSASKFSVCTYLIVLWFGIKIIFCSLVHRHEHNKYFSFTSYQTHFPSYNKQIISLHRATRETQYLYI